MRLTFFVTLFLFAHFSNAQFKSKNTEIYWGEETREKKYSFLNSIVSIDESGYYLGKSNYSLFNRGSSIVKFSKDLNKLKTLDLDDALKGTDFVPGYEMEYCGKIYSVQYPQKRKDNRVFVQQIDRQALTLTGDRKLVSDGNHPDISYKHYVSDDNSKIILTADYFDDAKKTKTFQVRSFDENFELSWKKEIPFKKDGFYHVMTDVEVSNSGDVFLVIEIGEEGNLFKKSSIASYEIVIIRNNGNTVTRLPLKTDEKYLYDLSITEDPNGLVTCVGFCSNETKGNIDGIYFSKIDGSDKFSLESFDKMPASFFTQYLKDGQAKKAEKKYEKGNLNTKFYDMSNVIRREDGGLVFITEEEYIVVNTVVNPSTGTTTTTTSYVYNDIIVVSISPDGKIEWTEKVPKEQITIEDTGYFSSFAYAVVQDNIYILFNDDPKNLLSYQDGKLKKYSSKDRDDGLVTLVKIDSQGNQTREALLDTDYLGLAVIPKACEQIEGDELLLFCHWKKSQKLGRLVFLNQ